MLNPIAPLWSRYHFTQGKSLKPLKYFLLGHIVSRRWNWALPVIFSDHKTVSYMFYPPLCTQHLVQSCWPVMSICRRDGGIVIYVLRTTGSFLSWVSIVLLAARMGPSRANVSKCWLLNKIGLVGLLLLASTPGSGPPESFALCSWRPPPLPAFIRHWADLASRLLLTLCLEEPLEELAQLGAASSCPMYLNPNLFASCLPFFSVENMLI